MSGPSIASGWHRVGAGLSVQFVYSSAEIRASWMPRQPTRREWKRVIERYRTARDQFVSGAISSRGPVMVLELS